MKQLQLLETQPMLSPRLEWMKKRAVHSKRNTNLGTGEDPWEAWIGNRDEAIDSQLSLSGDLEGPWLAAGETEDEAIFKLAWSNGWPLWNEGPLAGKGVFG